MSVNSMSTDNSFGLMRIGLATAEDIRRWSYGCLLYTSDAADE